MVKIVVLLKSIRPGIPHRGSLAVVIRMVFLDQGVMPLAHDPARFVVDDHAADRGASFRGNSLSASSTPMRMKSLVSELS